MQEHRRQLTLFVPEPIRGRLEVLRRVLDPVQAGLIPAHVTLCREEELIGIDWDTIQSRLSIWSEGPVTLGFGTVEPFGGHGILLPCVVGTSAFSRLRQLVLSADSIEQRIPHITLAHPRNPKVDANSLSLATGLPAVLSLTFSEVHLIRQEGGKPWVVIDKVTLQ